MKRKWYLSLPFVDYLTWRQFSAAETVASLNTINSPKKKSCYIRNIASFGYKVALWSCRLRLQLASDRLQNNSRPGLLHVWLRRDGLWHAQLALNSGELRDYNWALCVETRRSSKTIRTIRRVISKQETLTYLSQSLVHWLLWIQVFSLIWISRV